MTNAEAIEHLKNIKIYSFQDGYTDEAREALDMAIKALETQEQLANNSPELDKENGELIRRKAAIEALKEAFNPSITNFVKAKLAIENLPSAQLEEAIPVAWLEQQAKWFESMDNAFAKIEANNIRVMIKKWRMKKNERSDFKSGGD